MRLERPKEIPTVKRRNSNGRGSEAGAASRTEGEHFDLTVVNERDISDLAYQRWLDRGCPQGSPDVDWFEAERELRLRIQSEP